VRYQQFLAILCSLDKLNFVPNVDSVAGFLTLKVSILAVIFIKASMGNLLIIACARQNFDALVKT
jgi:hypothetical protein